jgi:O-antigen/teichoic acid export membrane protein
MNNQDHQSQAASTAPGEGKSTPTYTGAAVRGSMWSMLQTAGSKGLMLIVQWMLAKLLLPGDWGIAAIALSIAAALTIFSPLPLVDLLVQRGVKNALPNVLRIAAVTVIILAVVIAGSSIWAGIRPGQTLATTSGAPVTTETPIAMLVGADETRNLINQASGTFEVRSGSGSWSQASLPKLEDISMTLGAYARQIEDSINRAPSGPETFVRFDEDSSKLRVVDAEGRPLSMRTWSTADGSALDALGFEFRSRPLTLLLILLAAVPLLGLLKLPLASVLRLRLKFASIAAANFSGTIGGGVAAVTLAFLGAGSVALLMSHLAVPLITALVMMVFVGTIPWPRREEREPMAPLVRDASTLWLAQWVHSAGMLAPILILGWFTSAEEVGFFYFAIMLSTQVIALLAYNLSQSFTPIFSKLQDSPKRLATAYLRSTGAITAVTMPFLLGAAATASIFIPQIYTEKWAPAVPILMILLVAQSFASSNSTSAAFLKGSGRYKTWLIWQLMQNTIFVIAVVIAAWAGSTITVAWVVLGQHAIFAPFGVYLCSRGYASIAEILRVHIVPFIAASPLIIVGIISHAMGPSWQGLLIWCPFAGIVSGIIYVIVIRYLDRPRFDDFRDIADRMLQHVPVRLRPKRI